MAVKGTIKAASGVVAIWNRLVNWIMRVRGSGTKVGQYSAVLERIKSAGFWLKFAKVAKGIASGLSVASAIVMILEFASHGRDVTAQEAVELAKKRGIDELLKNVDDPDEVLRQIVNSMELKDEADRELVFRQLQEGTHKAKAAVAQKSANAPSSAPLVQAQASPPPRRTAVADADVIDAGNQSVRRPQPTTLTSAAQATITDTVEMMRSMKQFYDVLGITVGAFFRVLGPFTSPQSLDLARTIESKLSFEKVYGD